MFLHRVLCILLLSVASSCSCWIFLRFSQLHRGQRPNDRINVEDGIRKEVGMGHVEMVWSPLKRESIAGGEMG